MANVKLENITKNYGKDTAVHSFNLQTDDGEFVVLVGPSGCGKSTTLRMIAGLEEISDGVLTIDGKTVNNLSPKDRDIAMVFQNYALYPHMDVFGNMAFSLQLRKMKKSHIESRVQQAAQILGIDSLLKRKPRDLSGGQRQRVALGRAIVREPQVFLMDEPLSNLDAQLRTGMRAEISKLHRRIGVTSFYVTHDQIEALTMGHRIVVMREGYIQQVSTPTELYDQPVNKFVAGFIGNPAMNFLSASVAEDGSALTGEGFSVTTDDRLKQALSQHRSKQVLLGIRPEDIVMQSALDSAAPDSVLKGEVDLIEPLGPVLEIQVGVGETILTAQIDRLTSLHLGDQIELSAGVGNMHLFDYDSEQSLTALAHH